MRLRYIKVDIIIHIQAIVKIRQITSIIPLKDFSLVPILKNFAFKPKMMAGILAPKSNFPALIVKAYHNIAAHTQVFKFSAVACMYVLSESMFPKHSVKFFFRSVLYNTKMDL